MPIVNSLNILEQMYQQNRWPTVIVLEGAKHERQAILDTFIQLVFCQNKQRCGQCEQCLLIKETNHPDIHLVLPEQVGHVIKIEQIRDKYRKETGVESLKISNNNIIYKMKL